jgi:hypothetical protein
MIACIMQAGMFFFSRPRGSVERSQGRDGQRRNNPTTHPYMQAKAAESPEGETRSNFRTICTYSVPGRIAQLGW